MPGADADAAAFHHTRMPPRSASPRLLSRAARVRARPGRLRPSRSHKVVTPLAQASRPCRCHSLCPRLVLPGQLLDPMAGPQYTGIPSANALQQASSMRWPYDNGAPFRGRPPVRDNRVCTSRAALFEAGPIVAATNAGLCLAGHCVGDRLRWPAHQSGSRTRPPAQLWHPRCRWSSVQTGRHAVWPALRQAAEGIVDSERGRRNLCADQKKRCT